METRRLGRLEHRSSVLIFGAAALAEVDQATADAAIAMALEGGINHFDTAASYGEAELRMGASPLVEQRDQIFLASKTGDREAESAWASINRSLERLRTDRLDLLQLHAVSSFDDLDDCTRTGGALEGAIRARDEGLVRAIGITGHTHEAPAVHTEALRRFDFASVLTPLNWRLWRVPGYADEYQRLVAACQQHDTALMTIKVIAKRNWPTDNAADHHYSTWYEPFDQQPEINAATAWLLNGHPEVTGVATAGETRLLGRMLTAERERMEISLADVDAVLGGLDAAEYDSPFVRLPW
ncbi:MAG: aldo/keto reductase [Micropruina sp.]|nr:aldo/keto reductase [Micropruina sp.]